MKLVHVCVCVCLILYCSHLGIEVDITEVVVVRGSDFLFNRRAFPS